MPAARHQSIQQAIVHYASAYDALERLQEAEALLPEGDRLVPGKGDQKTGLIGEYWALCYARSTFPLAVITLAGHSQKFWDLCISPSDGTALHVQVKTASQFGSGKISPIHQPSTATGLTPSPTTGTWDELWILYLDRQLHPLVLWRFLPEFVRFGSKPTLINTSLRRPGQRSGGSHCFDWDNATCVTDFTSFRAQGILPAVHGHAFANH